MQPRKKLIQHRRQEQIDAPLAPWRSPLAKLLNVAAHLWWMILDVCTVSTELRIHVIRHRCGRFCWRVDDPMCDRPLWFDSEEDVLIWLETRHYRQRDKIDWNT